MSITITTLNNEAATARTFTGIAPSRPSQSAYINASDSSATKRGTLEISQSVSGKTRTGVPIRRVLVRSRYTAPTTVVISGNSVQVPEEVKVDLTLTMPDSLATLTATDRKDLVAFIRNLCTAANVDKLSNGEI